MTEALTAALGGTLFEQRKVLGRGGFGTIIKAVRRDTGVTVALKEVRKAPGSLGDDLTDEAVMAEEAAGSGGNVAVRGAHVERDVLSAVSIHLSSRSTAPIRHATTYTSPSTTAEEVTALHPARRRRPAPEARAALCARRFCCSGGTARGRRHPSRSQG